MSVEPYYENCEWCGRYAELIPTRDLDEGFAGSEYDVCIACRQKQDDLARKDLEELGDEEYP